MYKTGSRADISTDKMKVLLGLTALITLAFVVYGEVKLEDDSGEVQREYFQCGNTQCTDGFYCYHGNCRAKRLCSHHFLFPKDQYCDVYQRACRKGVRKCSHYDQCGSAQICKGWVCTERECMRHRDCPGNDACSFPPGMCVRYHDYCYEGYDNYCKSGYTCVNRKCTKKECNYDNECKVGEHCDGGFCKPLKDFCMSDGECAKGQCCARTGNGERGGVCRNLRKPGSWCPLQQNLGACPCVSGYVCKMKTNIRYGQCEEADGGTESGSGSGDF